MTLRAHRARPRLWLAMSILIFITLGFADWIGMKSGEPLFGISVLGSLRAMLAGREPVQRIWVLVPWLLGWLVITVVVGWWLHNAVVVLSSRLEKAKRSARYLVFLGALAVVLVSWLITRVMDSPGTSSASPKERWKAFAWGLIEKLPSQYRDDAYCLYLKTVEGEWPISVPYNSTNGPWIVWENAMAGFAKSNGIQILYFAGAGSTKPYVIVSHKDLAAMSRFVHSMGRSANKAGAASPSQSAGSETNRTSAATRSGR